MSHIDKQTTTPLPSFSTVAVRSPSLNLLSMTLIQSFPPEILSEIFQQLDFSSATLATLVCRQWHFAATGNSELWLTLEINNTDVERRDVVRRILARSQGRPLSLSLRFPATGNPINQKALSTFLRKVVRKHLRHCVRLFVYASQAAWRVLLKAFAGQTFPALLVVYLYNDDALAKWEIPRIGTAVPMPPADLVFPLPDGHGLWDAQLQGVSFADARLPKLYRLRINHDFPDMVLDDGRLNPWLFTHARELYFESMCVPVMDYALDTDTEEDPPTVQFLVLRDLCATPDDDDFEYDCGPFFSALQTSRVHSLVIDALDLDSRIWDDFIGALTINDPKFPLVTQLMLRQMDFAGMGYELVAFFLSAFPALEHFLIMDCFHERSSTWQDVIETLEMCPTLCVKLRELEVDDGFILRDDPMPFRDFMFDYDLPVE